VLGVNAVNRFTFVSLWHVGGGPCYSCATVVCTIWKKIFAVVVNRFQFAEPVCYILVYCQDILQRRLSRWMLMYTHHS